MRIQTSYLTPDSQWLDLSGKVLILRQNSGSIAITTGTGYGWGPTGDGYGLGRAQHGGIGTGYNEYILLDRADYDLVYQYIYFDAGITFFEDFLRTAEFIFSQDLNGDGEIPDTTIDRAFHYQFNGSNLQTSSSLTIQFSQTPSSLQLVFERLDGNGERVGGIAPSINSSSFVLGKTTQIDTGLLKGSYDGVNNILKLNFSWTDFYGADYRNVIGQGGVMVSIAAGSDTLSDGAIYATALYGTNAVDEIYGSSQGEEVFAESGDDQVDSGLGDDWVDGGSGNDYLNGGVGDDILIGGSDADVMWGGEGDDVYYVDNFNDRTLEAVSDTDVPLDIQRYFELWLDSNPRWLEENGFGGVQPQVITLSEVFNDLQFSNPGKASGFDYWYENISESINGGGDDLLYSSVTRSLGENLENLTLTGTAAINGTGNNQNNTLTGNIAANTLVGMDGTDTLIGGAGNDTYVVDSTTDTITEATNVGIDTIRSSVNYSMASISNVENLIYTGNSDWTAEGNTLNNSIAGGIGNDSIMGGVGADTLSGGAGNDTLDGGTGADKMTGGTGDDVYVVDNAKDTVTEKINEGNDTIETTLTSLSIAKGSAIENLTYTGLGNATLVGNASVNRLTGNSGADRLDGGIGGDSLIGGEGNDLYFVDDLNDTIIEALNEGTDTVQSRVTFTLLDNVENLTLTGTAAINGTGNNQNNTLTGNIAANTLVGDAGHDTLDGGAGNDSLIGGEGDDLLIGGLGNDLITGGDGADKFRFDKALSKTTVDTITDFATGIDRIELDDAIFKKFIGMTGQLTADKFTPTNESQGLTDYIVAKTVQVNLVGSIALFYDADGSGKGAAIQFATLVGGTDLSATDFWIV